jgi:hypothetical protein
VLLRAFLLILPLPWYCTLAVVMKIYSTAGGLGNTGLHEMKDFVFLLSEKFFDEKTTLGDVALRSSPVSALAGTANGHQGLNKLKDWSSRSERGAIVVADDPGCHGSDNW